LTFKEFGTLQLSVALSGEELIQMFIFLLEHEADCNDEQLRFFEKLRNQLYTVFTIEQLEQLADGRKLL
jgi:hypothetical protein